MPSKISERLMSAYMAGDSDEIDKIKSEISDIAKAKRGSENEKSIEINTVLNDEKAPILKVYRFINRALGEDWWESEIETIDKLLWTKYGLALEDANRDKVLALRHLCRSDGAFADWYEFNQLALSFSGSIADFEYLKAPSPGMAIGCVKAMTVIRPDRDMFFSNDVIKYMCIMMIDAGIYVPPPSIIFLVRERMPDFVSDETRGKWVDILKRYNELIDSDSTVEENEIDIQARRILNAEIAATKYCGE